MCTIVAALVALLLLIRASRQLIGLYSCFYEPVLNWKYRLISDDWRVDARVLFELKRCPLGALTHGLGWVEIFQFLVGWVGLGPLKQKY